MYYFNPLNPASDLLKINVQSVQQLIELNKQGNIPDSFADFIEKTTETSPNLENVLTEQSLHRFDKKKQRKRPERRKIFKKNKTKAYQKRKTKNV